jgi:hypothetical protein
VQNHESCCRSLVIPEAYLPAGDPVGTRLDTYEVTAGRMRQFIETVNAIEQAAGNQPYDLYDYMNDQVNENTPVGQLFAAQFAGSGVPLSTIIALFPSAYYGAPPGNDDIVAVMGGTTMDPDYPSVSQGCYTYADSASIQSGQSDGSGANGAATYFWPALTNYSTGVPGEDQVGGAPRAFTQDYYDIKPINCTPFYVYAAFCAWDGGHVATEAELQAVYGAQQYPWNGPGQSAMLPASYTYTTPAPCSSPLGSCDYQTFVPGTAYYSGPNGGLAGTPGYNAVDLTVNWNNDSFYENSGDFYFYPNGQPNAVGGYGVYGYAVVTPVTVNIGWDFSPFIAAPGRFYLDATYIQSPTASGNACSAAVPCPAGETCYPPGGGAGTCVNTWQDLGANLLEMAGTFVSGANEPFCDCSFGGQPDPDPSGDCSFLCPYQTYYPVLQAGGTTFPAIWWEGGSWEGHETGNPASAPYFGSAAYNEVIQAQYGKATVRCARGPEPAP